MSDTVLTPSILALNEGEAFDALGASIVLKTTGAQSGGQWFVMESHSPPRMSGPAPHMHKLATEIFVVLEGELTFQVGDQTRTVGAGGYACIPPGTVHTFTNERDAPVKYLTLTSPATMEGYFRELMARVQGGEWPPEDPQEIIALMARYDSFLS